MKRALAVTALAVTAGPAAAVVVLVAYGLVAGEMHMRREAKAAASTAHVAEGWLALDEHRADQLLRAIEHANDHGGNP